VAAVVAQGWYSGMGYRTRNRYGDDTALLMQVNVEYTNGEKEVIATDDSWSISSSAKASGVVMTDIYHGQTTDARLIDKNWTTTAYTEGAEWKKAEKIEFNKAILCSTDNELVKAQKAIKPIKYIVTPKGEKVLDFGQNIVGWERALLKGKAGDTIRLIAAGAVAGDVSGWTVSGSLAEKFVVKLSAGDDGLYAELHNRGFSIIVR
jgi:alpha-L-rhamnosidase